MAIMYPQRLSDRVLNNRILRGEVDTYKALTALPDEFEIFYNRSVGSGRGSKAHKRRIDFIILHEKLGLLAMEVKGGKIRIGQDGSVQQYHSTSRNWVAIDPYGQVERATIDLIKTCKADGANHWIPDDVCVIFPNTLRSAITDTPHLLPDGTLCADDLPLLALQIPLLFSQSRKNQAWAHDAFLDMRRRLQNTPEATARNIQEKQPDRKTAPQAKKITLAGFSYKKPTQSQKPDNNPSLSVSLKNHTKPLVPDYIPRAIPRTGQIRQRPATLKYWQIAAAVMAGLLAAALFSLT